MPLTSEQTQATSIRSYYATSTTSTTSSPAKLGNDFFAATCTATEPPMLDDDYKVQLIMVRAVKVELKQKRKRIQLGFSVLLMKVKRNKYQ